MLIRMLANVVGHEGVLSEGAVVDCQDPRLDEWLERGFAVPVQAVAEEPAPPPPAPREEPPVLAPTMPAPPEPAAEEPPQEPPTRRRRGH